MIIANLIEKERLRRHFHIITDEGIFEVIYDGTGMGYEEVLINDEIVNRQKSYFWYVPKFDFMIGISKARINVKVSLLFVIKAFNLLIDDVLIYSE